MTIPEAAQLVIQAGSLAKGGDIFVLDMGKPVKILELAKNMITLSGKKPVLAPEKSIGIDEIEIHITGLRQGEKMFEELSYSDTLSRTSHPRILSADDSSLQEDDMVILLDAASDAIAANNHQKLFNIIRQVCKHVATQNTSSDLFLKTVGTMPSAQI